MALDAIAVDRSAHHRPMVCRPGGLVRQLPRHVRPAVDLAHFDYLEPAAPPKTDPPTRPMSEDATRPLEDESPKTKRPRRRLAAWIVDRIMGDRWNFRYQATRHDRAMSRLLLFLLLAGCAAPSRAVYFYTKDTYGHYRLHYVAVPYTALGFYPDTYSKAQGTLDDFCNLPVADINRILKTVTDRFAKEIVCKQDSVHDAMRRARPEQAKTRQAIYAKKLSRVERSSDPHEFNTGSPNSEGGTGVYIDVSHGHPE